MMPLGLLSAGEKAVIIEVRTRLCEGNKNLCCHIEDIGFRAGKMIQMLNNHESNPVLIKLDESRIAVDRRIAMRIFVKKI